MTVERGEQRDGAPVEVFYIRKPYGENVYERMDDIGKLRYLACNGSKSAALYLMDHYSVHHPKNLDQRLKYASYAALAGDKDSYEWIRDWRRNLEGFYPEDVVLQGPFEHGGYHGYLVVPLNWKTPLLEGNEPYYLPIDVHDEDLIRGCYPYSHTSPPYRHGMWPELVERDDDTLSECYCGCDGKRYCVDMLWQSPESDDDRFRFDVLQYLGIGMERDEDAAIRDLLDMARGGSPIAMEMIAYAIGYERDTMRIRMPDDPSRSWFTTPEDLMPFGVPDCVSLEDSPEWRLLSMLARLDPDAFSEDWKHQGPDGGYEDDVLSIRPSEYVWSAEPTFVFKPSGFSMGWYKHAWRDPEQSEDLTVGEIRRVMRLCIEHIAYGREIPEGTTKELISRPMHLYEPPDEETSAALTDMARKAPCNLLELEYTTDVQTFDYRNAEEAERMALEIIRGLKGRPLQWKARRSSDRVSRKPGRRSFKQSGTARSRTSNVAKPCSRKHTGRPVSQR